MRDAFVPTPVVVVERIQESSTIFTLRLQLSDTPVGDFPFVPGQFNMLYLYGVGEVPISIVSDPQDDQIIDHTIRAVGRVTNGLAQIKRGDKLAIRGPFGVGWPVGVSTRKDVVIVTGGLGCAPVVSVINYILRRREQFNRLIIIQGVKHADDLIWRERYEQWMREKDVQVHIAADRAEKNWPWHVGRVTELCDAVSMDAKNCVVMMCGPEPMILASINCMLRHGVPESAIWMSMERNMQCGLGFCGHCQLGKYFVCKDGPVFNYPTVKHYLGKQGY